MAKRSRSTRASEAFVPPYPVSWFDRLTATIDRLPGPYWAPYLVAGLLYLGVVGLVVWQSGRPFTPGAVFTNVLPFYGFWLIHYLNRRAAWSLERFRAAFTGTERELQSVRWRLTTLPARPALAVSLAALLLGIASSLSWNSFSPLENLLGTLAYYATMAFGGLYAYHAIRQLRLVTALYAGRARVNLHNVAPLYSFSTLSAHTAIGMLLILSGAVLLTPEGLIGGLLVGAFLFGVLAVLTFLLPLAGLHGRLAEAKEQELRDNSRRWQACTAELYGRVDRGDWAKADRLNATLTALERGRTAIERVPTWPWRPETLRSMAAALLLPVVIWLLQFGLARFLG
jgi:hypothetical protein